MSKLEDFHIICQEAWETIGNSTQIDERFVELLYKNIREEEKNG